MLDAIIVNLGICWWAPSCDCIEFKVDFVDESLLQNAAQDARTDYLFVRDEYPKLALFDMDSTLIQQEVIDQLAGAFGLGQRVSVITERAMRGELDFVASFTERLSLLRASPNLNLMWLPSISL